MLPFETFKTMLENYDNSMNSSSGEFKVPTDGLYMFTISASVVTSQKGRVRIDVYENGDYKMEINEGTSNDATKGHIYTQSNISYVWMSRLAAGDLVHLKLYGSGEPWNGLHVCKTDHLYFSGQLMKH